MIPNPFNFARRYAAFQRADAKQLWSYGPTLKAALLVYWTGCGVAGYQMYHRPELVGMLWQMIVAGFLVMAVWQRAAYRQQRQAQKGVR
jgi:hypothetical protein